MTSHRFLFGIILIAIGLSIFTGFSVVQFIIALAFIYFGVRALAGGSDSGGFQTAQTGADVLHEVAVFSPLSRTISSPHFRGGRITVIFGGGEIDLREAKMEGPSIPLDITAIFGGIKLLVPAEWKVTSRGTAILGGYNNAAKAGDGGTLEISGAAILGGVDIANY